jgi:hypothetical protein
MSYQLQTRDIFWREILFFRFQNISWKQTTDSGKKSFGAKFEMGVTDERSLELEGVSSEKNGNNQLIFN